MNSPSAVYIKLVAPAVLLRTLDTVATTLLLWYYAAKYEDIPGNGSRISAEAK